MSGCSSGMSITILAHPNKLTKHPSQYTHLEVCELPCMNDGMIDETSFSAAPGSQPPSDLCICCVHPESLQPVPFPTKPGTGQFCRPEVLGAHGSQIALKPISFACLRSGWPGPTSYWWAAAPESLLITLVVPPSKVKLADAAGTCEGEQDDSQSDRQFH